MPGVVEILSSRNCPDKVYTTAGGYALDTFQLMGKFVSVSGHKELIPVIEAELPAVLSSAQPGAERDKVANMIEWLTQEHRDVESLWKQLEPALKKLAKGQDADLDGTAIEHLVTKYKAHAQFEEAEFLPLAETILGRNSNHMAALGLSLHLRHQPRFFGHL